MDGLLWEMHQNRRIGRAHRAAGTAQSAANDAKFDVQELDRRVDKLTMIVEALWSFLQREHGYSEQELIDVVTEIDLRDGLLDGKVKRLPRDCAECGKVIGADRSNCMWCGYDDPSLFGNTGGPAAGDGPRGLAP